MQWHRQHEYQSKLIGKNPKKAYNRDQDINTCAPILT